MLPRVLTALVGLPVLAAAIWYGSPWLTLLVLAAAVLGVREFYRLTPPGVGPLSTGLGVLWVAALVLSAQATDGTGGFLIVSAIVWAAGAFVALLWMIALYPGGGYPVAGVLLLAGPLYVGFLLSHALLLREVDGVWDAGASVAPARGAGHLRHRHRSVPGGPDRGPEAHGSKDQPS